MVQYKILAEPQAQGLGSRGLGILTGALPGSSTQSESRLTGLGRGVDRQREAPDIYTKTIKADPNAQSVEISLYASLLAQIVAGGGFEPPTSGL